MSQCSRTTFVVAAMWLMIVVTAHSQPVRRAQDIEARRRSAIDRSLVRFGRSYPAEPSAAEIREQFNRQARSGTNFLRLGRSQPLTLSTDDLISLLRAYEDDYEEPSPKRASSNFLRFGRNPKFIRLGRSAEEENQPPAELVNEFPQRKSRAKTLQFVRLGRDSEELGEELADDDRTKRSVECQDCH
ncbi:hypothetical protein O0L34_g10372 [Tuta absoluta]|nr:hypothetical protein O0L34_g10372 [Tuta absoluta]